MCRRREIALRVTVAIRQAHCLSQQRRTRLAHVARTVLDGPPGGAALQSQPGTLILPFLARIAPPGFASPLQLIDLDIELIEEIEEVRPVMPMPRLAQESVLEHGNVERRGRTNGNASALPGFHVTTLATRRLGILIRFGRIGQNFLK